MAKAKKYETIQELIFWSYANLAMANFAQKWGGKDNAENLIFACRSCNSSKGKKDLMEWMNYRGEFLPLMIIRRYLKLVFRYCSENGLLEKLVEEVKEMELPFKIEFIPTNYPTPSELKLSDMFEITYNYSSLYEVSPTWVNLGEVDES